MANSQRGRGSWRTGWAAALVVVFGCGGSSPEGGIVAPVAIASDRSPAGGVLQGGMVEPFEEWLTLSAGRTIRLETRSCAPGANPVLHLLDSGRREVAMDDNGGGGVHARLVYTASSLGQYWVILRGATNFSRGQCSLYLDGVPWRNASAGGSFIIVENVRAGEQLETVQMLRERSSRPHEMFLFAAGASGQIAEVRVGGGTGRGTRLTLTAPAGSRTVMLSTPGASYRFVRNDTFAGHDPDGDGLGSELEEAIGTCSNRSAWIQGFACGWSADARDTDGDGLSDFWEVLGKRDGQQPHQLLPAWGANPRHKDLFIEVDSGQSRPDSEEVFLSAEGARAVAAAFAAELGNLDAGRRAGVAHVLRNPDGQPGIRVHFDTGVAPATPGDDALFGNWGGHSLVPPVWDGSDWRGRSEAEGYFGYLGPGRRGVFRYILGYPGGGQCPERSPACAVGVNDPTVMIHELGHNLGLGHSGPSFGDTADPNCKPHYVSVMNYAYQEPGFGFSDGAGPKVLHNAQLSERATPRVTDWLLDHLVAKFEYNVDRANRYIDWNRDGVFQTGTVKSYMNYARVGGCEWTRYSQTSVAATASPSTPALLRVAGTVYAFYTTAGRIGYAYTNSALNCPGPEPGCNGMTWTVGGPVGGDVRAMDALGPGNSVANVVLVVFVNTAGALYERRLIRWGSGTGQLVEFGGPPLALGGSAAVGEPSLARLADGRVLLAYKGADGRLRTRLREGNLWQREMPAEAATGGLLPPLKADASPAVAWVSVPADGATSVDQFVEGLYAALPHDSALDLYRYDPGIARWRRASPWEDPSARPGDVVGKAAMAFIPGNSSGRAARFYLHFRDPGGLLHHMISYARGAAPASSHVVGMRGFFDNDWSGAAAHALMYERASDTSLRSVSVLEDGRLDFRPKADGSTTHPMINWNDWEVLGNETCLTTVGSGEGSNPVRCHAWKWSPGRYGGELRFRAEPSLCLQKKNDNWDNGNPLHLWDCQQQGEHMKAWIWDRALGQIRARDNELLCWHKERLDELPGQRIHLWRCLEGGVAQKSWDYEEDTGLIRNRTNPNVCIVKKAGSPGNGVEAVLGPCPATPDSSAQWEF